MRTAVWNTFILGHMDIPSHFSRSYPIVTHGEYVQFLYWLTFSDIAIAPLAIDFLSYPSAIQLTEWRASRVANPNYFSSVDWKMHLSFTSHNLLFDMALGQSKKITMQIPFISGTLCYAGNTPRLEHSAVQWHVGI
jgi:hypothetical protein